MKYYSFDVWIGSIKAALCREVKVRTTTFQYRGLHHRNNTGLESWYWISTCVLLSLAAVRGCVRCDVFWVDAVFALCPVLILVLAVAVRGQTAQNWGSSQLVPAETARWNDEHSWGTDTLPSGFTCACTHHYLRAEVVPSGGSGLCRSCQSRSLILIVSSGASRHTKMQLTKKKHLGIKNSVWLLRKLSVNTFRCSFPPAAQSQDGFNLETDAIQIFHSSSYFGAKIQI